MGIALGVVLSNIYEFFTYHEVRNLTFVAVTPNPAA